MVTIGLMHVLILLYLGIYIIIPMLVMHFLGLQRANNLRTDRMLAMLQSRVNAEWRVTARYMLEEKSCVNGDRETSVIGK